MIDNIKIATGTDNFSKMIINADVFVDKTLLIKNIIDIQEEAMLITRPRRWGKTLNLDMLARFFAIEVDSKGEKVAINSNRVLFEGGIFSETRKLKPLKIAKEDARYMEHQGKYPVIFFSLKDVKKLTYGEVVGKLKELVSELYIKHKYLTKNNNLDTVDKETFQQYMGQVYNNVSLENSLKFLSKLLYEHHNQTVYILVDEYDKPVNYFLEHALDYAPDERKQTAELITGIMSSCGKGNEYLENIILTGILDSFTKEGGSGFNNLAIHDISDYKFSESFGFSEVEVKDLLSQAELPDSLNEPIANWYDGYTLSSTSSKNNESLYSLVSDEAYSICNGG